MNMKGKTLVLFFAFLLSGSFGSDAESAGTLVYSPGTALLSVPAGSTGTTAMSAEVVDSSASSSSLTFLSEMSDGNLPMEWISASPGSVFVRNGTAAATVLTVSVPADTPAGIYAGHLVSYARAVHGVADPGAGFFLSINVPASCSGPGSVQVDSFGPSVIWPPDHSLQPVTITGSMLLPAGCSMLEAAYEIQDEYGIYSGKDRFSVAAGGSFSIVLPVEAWREGQDKDGRHYSIWFTVRDEAGTGTSAALQVLVPHDRRRQTTDAF